MLNFMAAHVRGFALGIFAVSTLGVAVLWPLSFGIGFALGVAWGTSGLILLVEAGKALEGE